MIAFDDSALRKPRAKFDAAAADMAAAVTAGALLAAAQVAARSSSSDALQAIRAEVRHEAIGRRVLDSAGQVADSVLITLPGPWWEPQAFDACVWTTGRLLLSAWDARRAGGPN